MSYLKAQLLPWVLATTAWAIPVTLTWAQPRPSPSQEKELSQLSDLLTQNLDFKGEVQVHSAPGKPLSDAAKLEALLKLKRAIEQTRLPVHLRGVQRIILSESGRTRFAIGPSDGSPELRLSLRYPPEAWIRSLSQAPDAEPAYRQYVATHTKATQEKLALALGPLAAFHEQGRKLLCMSDAERSALSPEAVSALFMNATGSKVRQQTHTKPPPSDTGRTIETFTYELDRPPPSAVRFERIYEQGKLVERYVGIMMSGKRLAESMWDSECQLENLVQWSHDPSGVIEEVKRHDDLMELTSRWKPNVRPLALDAIYNASCTVNLGKTNAEILALARRTDRVVVAILDTGVDYNHPSLAYKIPRVGEMTRGVDVADNDDFPYDYDETALHSPSRPQGHGTHVAGIASGGSDDIEILPLRNVAEHPERFGQAIAHAKAAGTRIVNISQGHPSREMWKKLEESIRENPEMLFFVAAGNKGKDLAEVPEYPAALEYPNLVKVAAVGPDGILASFSNRNKSLVQFAAPGVNIESCAPGGGKCRKSGTSMASPYVANLAAKILALNPRLTATQVIGILRDSVVPDEGLLTEVKYGGVPNEARALELVRRTLEVATRK